MGQRGYEDYTTPSEKRLLERLFGGQRSIGIETDQGTLRYPILLGLGSPPDGVMATSLNQPAIVIDSKYAYLSPEQQTEERALARLRRAFLAELKDDDRGKPEQVLAKVYRVIERAFPPDPLDTEAFEADFLPPFHERTGYVWIPIDLYIEQGAFDCRIGTLLSVNLVSLAIERGYLDATVYPYLLERKDRKGVGHVFCRVEMNSPKMPYIIDVAQGVFGPLGALKYALTPYYRKTERRPDTLIQRLFRRAKKEEYPQGARVESRLLLEQFRTLWRTLGKGLRAIGGHDYERTAQRRNLGRPLMLVQMGISNYKLHETAKPHDYQPLLDITFDDGEGVTLTRPRRQEATYHHVLSIGQSPQLDWCKDVTLKGRVQKAAAAIPRRGRPTLYQITFPLPGRNYPVRTDVFTIYSPFPDKQLTEDLVSAILGEFLGDE